MIEKSKTWDKKSPILPNHELSMTDDLTDNDIVMRQINCAPILRRNLELHLRTNQLDNDSRLDFCTAYYGDQYYWLRQSYLMRLIMLIFPVVYVLHVSVLKILLLILSRFMPQANLTIQMKNKVQAYRKCRIYMEKLCEPVPVSLGV